jgi:hypothetical protein
MKASDPYLKPGRLADVLAALQVIASAERPERKIKDWADELDRKHDEAAIAKWRAVFEEHPEFFLTYRLPDEEDLKAALRLRYVVKTFDPKTGIDYTQAQISEMSNTQRWGLTTKPLGGDQIQALVSTAIALHTRALGELQASRWWIPIIAAVVGFFGALLGGVFASVLGVHK